MYWPSTPARRVEGSGGEGVASSIWEGGASAGGTNEATLTVGNTIPTWTAALHAGNARRGRGEDDTTPIRKRGASAVPIREGILAVGAGIPIRIVVVPTRAWKVKDEGATTPIPTAEFTTTKTTEGVTNLLDRTAEKRR